ncbi:hypothetical protein BsWGS_10277 [Bradybaena similaris]
MSLNQFSQEQTSSFQEAFGLFDKDGDGYLSSAEVGVIIRSLGGVVTENELKKLQEQFDHKNGQVNFADFLSLMATIMNKNDSPDDLLKAFQVFDSDNKGYITAKELRHLMTNLGEKLTKEDVDEMIKEADVNGTGNINYVELVRIMTS